MGALFAALPITCCPLHVPTSLRVVCVVCTTTHTQERYDALHTANLLVVDNLSAALFQQEEEGVLLSTFPGVSEMLGELKERVRDAVTAIPPTSDLLVCIFLSPPPPVCLLPVALFTPAGRRLPIVPLWNRNP